MESVHLINQKTHYFLGTMSVVILVFIGSLFFAPYYIGGDQAHYIRIYDEIKNFSLLDAHNLYRASLVSWELGHFSVIWATSSLGIEKNLVMALVNSALAYYIMKICYKWRVSLIVSSSLCITNFYMLALYFSLERLKIAFLFFIISIYYINNKKKLFVFSFFSVVSHVQFFILYLGLLLPKFFGEYFIRIKRIFVEGKIRIGSELIGAVIFLIMAIFIWLFMGDHLINKFNSHSEYVRNRGGLSDRGTILNMLRVFIFYVGTLIYAKNYKVVTLNYLPLIIAIYFVSGDRLNIFAYVLFMSYAITHKRGLNIGVIVTSIYFSFKSIGFVNRIFESGYGY